MKLYEYAEEFGALFDSLDEMDGEEMEQAWFDTLESIEAEFEDKAENLIAFIKELNGQAAILREQEKAFAERRRTKERRAERLKKYLLGCMNAVGRKKIDRPLGCASVRNNAETPRFADEGVFIAWAKNNAGELLRYKDPEIDKAAVKRCLQEGHEIVGVTLERSQSVIIK
jgi:hypothetical protein